MKSNTLETLVGAAVIAAAVLFFFFAYNAAGLGGPSGGYRVNAQFDNIDGIAVGTDVRVAGIKVGTVVGQSLDPKSFQARVQMLVQPQVQLSDDTSAKISAEGLLGAKFVALEPGGSESKLKDGSEISYTQGSVDLWSLISQAMFSKGSKSGDGAAAPAPSQDGGAAQAPLQDAPSADVPKTDAAPVDVPKTDAAPADVPKTDVPKTDVPKTDAQVPPASASDQGQQPKQ